MNLLVSVLGDSYNKVSEEKLAISLKEKCDALLTAEYNLFWKRFTDETNSYIHCIEYDYLTTYDGTGGEG